MKKILLIGDSIRLSYRTKVAELLEGRATLAGPDENCRFSAYTLFNLSSWLGDESYDVIHWNNGQWDTCHMPDGKIHTPLKAYLDLQERIAGILKTRTKRLVFATTTPVWPEQFDSGTIHPRRNEDITAYNAAATELMRNLDVEVNDLHTPVVAEVKRFICDDMVHLTTEGVDLCARKIAALISPQS